MTNIESAALFTALAQATKGGGGGGGVMGDEFKPCPFCGGRYEKQHIERTDR
jgi:hypothetical protein